MYTQFVPQADRNPRFFTARECARLQGFPDAFQLYKVEGRAYFQIGNAVSPPIIERIGAAIVTHLQACGVELFASSTAHAAQ